MTAKLGGRALATKIVTDNELTTYKLEGGFVATPVYGVVESSPTEGGALQPVYVIDATDLKQNGGRFTLAKGTSLSINTYITSRKTVRGRAIPVYVMGGVVNVADDSDPPVEGSAVDFGTVEYWQPSSSAGTLLPPGGPNGIDSGGFEYWQSGMLPPVFTVV